MPARLNPDWNAGPREPDGPGIRPPRRGRPLRPEHAEQTTRNRRRTLAQPRKTIAVSACAVGHYYQRAQRSELS